MRQETLLVVKRIHAALQAHKAKGLYGLGGDADSPVQGFQFFLAPLAQHVIYLGAFVELIADAETQPRIYAGVQGLLYAF